MNFESMQEMLGQMGDGDDFEVLHEQIQKSREEQDNKIKSVLTQEQWRKYQACQEEMNSRRGQGDRVDLVVPDKIELLFYII